MKISRHHFLWACLCWMMTGTAAAAAHVKSDAVAVIEIGGARGIIATPNLASEVVQQCSRTAPDVQKISEYWAPDRQQLEALESLLPAYVKQQNSTIQNLSGYRRIYTGILYEGRKVIYVDFARMHPDRSDWTDLPHSVCDGGDSFFGIEFDVKTQSFSHLYFNGSS